jgi:hypothetical protein
MSTFRDLGYTLASLPAADIKPLQLLIRTGPGAAKQLNSELPKLFLPNNVPVPMLSSEKPVPPDIELSQEFDASVDAQVSILQNLLKIFTGDAGASFTWKKARKARLSLSNARKQMVDLIELDTYLHDAEVNDKAKSIIKELKDDQLYIISEIIKTKTFSLSLESGSETDIKAELPTQVATGKIEIGKDKEGKLLMSANGSDDLTVAIRAVRIFFDRAGLFGGKKGKFRLSADEELKVFRSEEDFPAVTMDDVFFEFGNE